ncbi:6506_t:CDS:2 [Acaulospora morrowiae]|uniref:6506_t:CDS:1 n=1 Tax=Acaulospora morrowiae TaxID=94023 RepID=A0A9N8WBD3_9GLOM|nr:6506_t:CDS:2 [Acaulospora morrowiae]
MKTWFGAVIVFLIVFATQQVNSARCFRYPNPRERNFVVEVNCSQESEKSGILSTSLSYHYSHSKIHHVSKDKKKPLHFFSSSPHYKRSTNSSSNKNYFIFKVACHSDAALCMKMFSAFEDAGNIFSTILDLNAPIVVNVTIFNFCADESPCDPEDKVNPGVGYSSLLILLNDDDNVERFYPQSLVKQFNYTTHPRYDDADIYAQFNANPKYWFRTDHTRINDDQIDFLEVVLHEVFHGLGFDTSWGTYSYAGEKNFVLPAPIAKEDVEWTNSENYNPSINVTWSGFREFVFDRYLVQTEDFTYLTNFTTKLNQYFVEHGLVHASYNGFIDEFKKSDQYAIAENMMKLFTKPGSVGFMTWDSKGVNDSIILETEVSPFNNEYSIRHVDYRDYTDTADFLMRYLITLGEDLGSKIICGKNKTMCGDNNVTYADNNVTCGDNYYYGLLKNAIGPELRKFLETVGYSTKFRKSTIKIPQMPSPIPPMNVLTSTAIFNTPELTTLLIAHIVTICLFTIRG